MTGKQIILAIDPGPQVHSAVVWDPESWDVLAVEHDTCESRLDRMVDDIIDDDGSPHVLVEMPAPMGTVLGHSLRDTILSVGRLQYMFHGRFEPVERMEVKRQLLGRTTGTDAHVNAAVRGAYCDRLGIDERECIRRMRKAGVVKHAWPALALCVAWARMHS